MITDERLRWLSGPDYIRSEPGAVAAELLAARHALREVRKWIGDGEHGDGLHHDHWTPEYKAVVDLVDRCLTAETKGEQDGN